MQILLNSLKDIKSVNEDNYNKVELSNTSKQIYEYDIRNVLSVAEQFNIEREFYEVYRIYGRLEYLSMLNGLRNNYTEFTHFFQPQTNNCKDIFNSFDFYLVKPANSGYTKIVNSNIDYLRCFEVIATPNDFEIYDAGFATNVFDEQTYIFNFNKDFNISGFLDGFGFPLTELFLYIQYKPKVNGNDRPEKLYATIWSILNGSESKIELTPITSVPSFNVGDILNKNGTKICDVVEYSKLNYYQTQKKKQYFYIETPFDSAPKRILWKYSPLIPLRLRYLSENLYKENTGSTIYDKVSTIPYYAQKLDDSGNYVWREILPQGYFEPLTGNGVDYPFVNQRRYLFSSIIVDIIPDLSDSETYGLFKNAWFTRPDNQIILHKKITNNINDLGKPCL